MTGANGDVEPAAPAAPLLRVVRGEPTPDELAALVAVLTARGSGDAPEDAPRSAWLDRATGFRVTPAVTPGAWRWSSFASGHRTRADW